MVLQKRLDYGFNGYQVPAIPRASRSARVRGSRWKKVENSQMCAFELLATVAGKFLETESSPAPSNASMGKDKHLKREKQDEEKPLKVEPCDQGSCDESFYNASELGSLGHTRSYTLKKVPHPQNDVGLKAVEEFPGYGEYSESKVECGIERTLKGERKKIGDNINVDVPNMYSLEDPMEMDTKPPTQFSSDSSVEVPLCRNVTPCGSSPRYRDNLKVGSRDDDENSSGCTQPCTVTSKAFRSQPRMGDRRIRKLLASKYWKVAPKLKDGERSNSEEEMKPVYRSKICYARQRSQKNSPFKKRKFFNQNSVSTSDGGISSEAISASPKKGVNNDPTGSGAPMHGVSGGSSSVAGQQASFQSRDPHVKLRIKSFRVPELFIEIPETATFGSLKRTVMEAVSTILGGELRVGVLLQGKKIRDDNKTLLQSGISRDDELDTLGFMLEPNPDHASKSLCAEEPSFPLPYDTPQPLARYPATSILDPGTSDASPDLSMTKLGNCVESDNDSVPFPTDILMEKNMPDSRALVAVPAMSVEALAVVPLHQKCRRSEVVQRRIRRPFSVTEVEALVHAVEKLGTGRWRDVKIRAFDNAKHRTYVDLKDKWKTLVHTARISPQQRRGEPVPQELLDRVLSAHAYWSQQQAKHQVKHHSETCLLI